MAAQPIRLPIPVVPLPILITLVGSDHDDRTRARDLAQRLQEVCRAHHIGVQRVQRLHIGGPYQRLRGEMEDIIRPHPLQQAPQGRQVAHITQVMLHVLTHPRQREQARFRRRRQGITDNARAQGTEPNAEPGPLETRVAGYQRRPTGIGGLERLKGHFHTFQGALPVLHNSSKRRTSRMVSMHCQNPSCRYAAS